jgi:hypothetical protein
MANKKTRAATTATEALKILWEDAFFTSWRKFGAIEEHLAKRGNHFSVPELGMALKRSKHLTRRGKAGNYEYIQKYPPSAIETPTKAKKKGRL